MENNNNYFYQVGLWILGTIISTLVAQESPPPNVLLQGIFQPAGEYGLPWGWTLTKGKPQQVSVLRGKNNRTALQIQHEGKEDTTILETKVTLYPEWQKVAFIAQARFLPKEDSENPSAGFEFMNGPTPIPIPKSEKWEKVTKIWDVTEKTELTIRIGLWNTPGVLQISDIQLIPQQKVKIPGPPKKLEIKTNYGVPADWTIESGPKDWLRVFVFTTPQKNSAIRIKQDKPDTFVLTHNVQIPTNWRRFYVFIDVESKDLQRVGEGFETARIELEGEGMPFRTFGIYKSMDWTTFVKEMENPNGTDSFKIRFGFWKTSGSVSIGNVRVQPIEIE